MNALGDEEYEYLLSMERKALEASSQANGIGNDDEARFDFDLDTDIPSQNDVEAYLLNRRKQVRTMDTRMIRP